MKNKVFLMVGLLAFVVIMVVAMVLYEKLGSEADNGPVMVESSDTVDAASDAEESASEDIEDDDTSAFESADTPESDASAEESTAGSESSSMKAPDFTVYDKEGNPVKLSEYAGKPVILNFWASWCNPCKAEMPDFEAAYKQYGEDIHFMMVNQTDGSHETVDTASAFIQSTGYTFPVYFDTDLKAASMYDVSAIPMTFFIDAEGNFIAYAQGTLSADGLAQGISMIMN